MQKNCNQNSTAIACTQDIEGIFDNTYVTSNTDNIDLFRGEIYICLYSVFVKVLLSDQGKKICVDTEVINIHIRCTQIFLPMHSNPLRLY